MLYVLLNRQVSAVLAIVQECTNHDVPLSQALRSVPSHRFKVHTSHCTPPLSRYLE